LRVLAQAACLRDAATLKQAGADQVYSGAGEVALALIENILDHLGATPGADRSRAGARPPRTVGHRLSGRHSQADINDVQTHSR
jgi:hypothetical protein